MDQNVLELKEGWEIIQTGITKLINILEGVPDESPTDAATMYHTIYTMCTQTHPHDYSEQLYKRYEGVYNNYLQSRVLPAIQEKKHDDVSMLQELVKRWENHKVMVTKLCRYFIYLDRYYICRRRLATLKEVGFRCFRKIVFEEMKDAVMPLINREEIDQTLIKNVSEMFVHLGNKGDTQNMDSPTCSEAIARRRIMLEKEHS